MTSFIAKAQVVVEVKMFLETNSLEEIKEKLDKLYMVMILCAMSSDFDHIPN